MYHLHYTSADSADHGTWSVYVESYETPESEVPIDGTQEWVSSHDTEAEAEAEAKRLQWFAARVWRTYPHESCEEWTGTPDTVTRTSSRLAGNPVWICNLCGHRSVYVECGCDLSHYCDGSD